MNYLDFHSFIQPQPSTTNVNWSDEDCDYIFATIESSAVVSGETASSSHLSSNKE
jgi:hypothetical protein